jgi:uncharacterized membrane protein
MSWEKDLQRWIDANLIDTATAERIRQFEETSGKGRMRWPAMLAIGFGAVMLCAGILLFVSAHWDQLSPAQRFILVLSMVALFHIVAGLLGSKVPAMGVALHVAGTASLGAGVYLAGQIFNLEEHWPGGIMMWAAGAVLAWLVLRQWPQALLAAVLIPSWIGGEWDLATEAYRGSGSIAAQGFLLLAIFYMSATPREPNRALRTGLVWIGALSLLPLLTTLMVLSEGHGSFYWTQGHPYLPMHLRVLGYAAAYAPILALAVYLRKKDSVAMFAVSLWIVVLAAVCRVEHLEKSPWLYLWMAVGAFALCYWGVRENHKLFINYGTVIFAMDVIGFYFSSILDKLGRSAGLILLGVIFLAGGWILNRVRADLIARASAAGGAQ